MRTPAHTKPVPAWLAPGFFLVGRSLFPIVALLLITGTLLVGPWVTLGLTVLWWRVVTWTA